MKWQIRQNHRSPSNWPRAFTIIKSSWRLVLASSNKIRQVKPAKTFLQQETMSITPGKSASFLTVNNLGVTKVSINPFAISGRIIPSVRDFVISIVREIVKVQRKSSCRGEIIKINPRWIIARNVRLSWILRDTWVFSPHFSLSILKTQIPLVRALQTPPHAAWECHIRSTSLL